MRTNVQAQVQAVQDFADQLYDMNAVQAQQIRQQEERVLNLEQLARTFRSDQQHWNGVAEAMLREFARQENKRIQKLSEQFEIWEKRVADLCKRMEIFDDLFTGLSKRVSELECPEEEEYEEEEEVKFEGLNFPKFEVE